MKQIERATGPVNRFWKHCTCWLLCWPLSPHMPLASPKSIFLGDSVESVTHQIIRGNHTESQHTPVCHRDRYEKSWSAPSVTKGPCSRSVNQVSSYHSGLRFSICLICIDAFILHWSPCLQSCCHLREAASVLWTLGLPVWLAVVNI